jgi:hypothetical protein
VLDTFLERRIHLLAYGFHDRSQLFGTHDRCLCVGPGKEEAGGVCATASGRVSLYF